MHFLSRPKFVQRRTKAVNYLCSRPNWYKSWKTIDECYEAKDLSLANFTCNLSWKFWKQFHNCPLVRLGPYIINICRISCLIPWVPAAISNSPSRKIFMQFTARERKTKMSIKYNILKLSLTIKNMACGSDWWTSIEKTKSISTLLLSQTGWENFGNVICYCILKRYFVLSYLLVAWWSYCRLKRRCFRWDIHCSTRKPLYS